LSVVIVGVIRRKPVLTHASIVCEGMLASVNSVKKNQFDKQPKAFVRPRAHRFTVESADT